MIDQSKLPGEYKPFKHLEVCSNIAENVQVLFLVARGVPLLIGAGTKPRIWLYSPMDLATGLWSPLVRNNLPGHEWIQIIERAASVEVRGRGEVLLRCEAVDEDSAFIAALDLRPIGLDIHGTSESLITGGITWRRNVYRNAAVMISL